jgi:serine/threonine protein kinase
MKRICTMCGRASSDGNLWCQEKYCPAEKSPEVFERGEVFGNFDIIEMVTMTRSSAVYEAQRNMQKILLKIAHEGCHERLKREALLLMALAKVHHPMLPVLLPAHELGLLKDYPYGKTVVKGETKYYEVFDFVEGTSLRDLLLKNPQPWYQHVGWLTISLADVLALLHQSNRLHFSLCPEIILVRFDRQQVPRPVLLDLGLASDSGQLVQTWDQRFVQPAYTAPELIEMQGKVGPATDVYGLGLLLYEMLAGKPVYEYRLQRDEVVYATVTAGQPDPLIRADLRNVPQIAERAVNKDYASRQRDVLSFARELQANFQRVPQEKKEFRIPWRGIAIVVGTLLALSLLLALAVAINPASNPTG